MTSPQGRGPRHPTPGFCDWEAAQVERAARRIAATFGYGSGWLADCQATGDGSDSPIESDALGVAKCGRPELASVEIDGVAVALGKRQRRWRLEKALQMVPVSRPRVEEAAALAFARVDRRSMDLLLAFCCEDSAAWMRLEAILGKAPQPHALPAIRDAMARIMFRRAGASIEARARELRTRSGDYRAMTREAERFLRARLVEAAIALNGQSSNEVHGRTSTLPETKEVGLESAPAADTHQGDS